MGGNERIDNEVITKTQMKIRKIKPAKGNLYIFAYCVYVFLYILPKQHLDDGSKNHINEDNN